MTEQEFFDACGHKGFSELQTEDGKTLRVLAYHIGQQDARLRVRISYSTTELGRRLRGQERVTLWGSNWRVVRGHAQERAEVMQAMLESEISYAGDRSENESRSGKGLDE